MAIADGSREYVEWISHGVSHIFPEAWADFERGAHRQTAERVLDAYVRQLTDPDPGVREAAAMNWCTWEDAHMQIPGGLEPGLVLKDAQWREVFALQVAWSWSTQFSLPDNGVLEGLDRIAHLLAILVHGRSTSPALSKEPGDFTSTGHQAAS